MSNIITILQNKKKSSLNACIFLGKDLSINHSITYKELDEKARKIANFLNEKNLERKFIIILYPPGIEFITAFLGTLYAGAIAIPVHWPKLEKFEDSINFLKTIIQDIEISGIFTSSSYFQKLQAIFNDKKIFTIADTEKNDSIHYKIPNISEDTIAYLQYSSGSISAPKAAIIRHKNLIYNLEKSARAWKYSNKSITLVWTPHTHVYGLVCGILLPLYKGSKLIMMSPDTFIQNPLNWLQAITKYQVTHSGCPNFGYDLCINEINESAIKKLNLTSWKVAVNGGERVLHSTLQKFSEKFKPCGFDIKHFCIAYGMSEMSGTVTVSKYAKKYEVFNSPQGEIVSNGELLEGIKAKVIDPETKKILKNGEVGEICLSGGSLVSGYWNRLDETKELFDITLPRQNKKYFRTGDLGFILKKELYITGRLKDLIIIHGKKYSPIDIEITAKNALNEISFCKTSVVIAINENEKEKLIYLQEINPEVDNNTKNNIIDLIRKSILKQYGIHVADVIFVKINSLPKTQSGKLQRRLCREYYLKNKLKLHSLDDNESLKNSHVGLDEINKEFIELISSLLKIDKDQINLNSSLSNYNFDSISLTQLANKINEKYKLSITPDIFFEYSSLNEILNNLIKKNNISHSFKKIQNVPKKNNLDIAIIGMSGIFPGAKNIEEFWKILIEGRNVINEIPKDRWMWEEYYGDSVTEENKTKVKWGGFIEDITSFDASFFSISPREAELADPQQRIFLQVVWNTFENAGYSIQELEKYKIGLFVGVFNNDYSEILQKNAISDAYITTGVTHSILANRVSYFLNLHGPSCAVDTACSSSLVAIHNAVLAIYNGDCEMAIAGGVNAILTPTTHIVASKAGMLSEDGKCKTFDKSANGYVRSEGAAAILLKPLARAIADQDHIYGIIKGTAVNHGGHVNSLTVPNPNSQAEVIIEAITRAQIPIDTINYIETHGTGTSLGDPVEINGLKKAFLTLSEIQETKLENATCALGAVKSNIGHLEAAAGIAGIIKILLAMKYRTLPGNLHFVELNPYINLSDSPFFINNKTNEWKHLQNKQGKDIPYRAGVSSFGYGGSNTHVILEEYMDSYVKSSFEFKPTLIAISAKNEHALKQRFKDLYDYIEKYKNNISLTALSYTLNVGRTHFSKRAIILIDSIEELQFKLSQIIQGKQIENYIISNVYSDKSQNKSIFNIVFNNLINEINSNDKYSTEEYKSKLLALGIFFTEGFEIEWDKMNFVEKKRIPLPEYPFSKDYYWITKDSNKKASQTITTASFGIQIEDNLLRIVAQLLKINLEKIDLTISLSDLGFDSISFKDLALILEKEYDVEFNPSIFFNYHNIKDLAHYLSQNIKLDKIKNEKHHIAPNTVEKNKYQNVNEPIAVIGMSGYFPKSKDLNEFWSHLINGHDLISEVPKERWDYTEHYSDLKNDKTKSNSKWGGFLTNIDMFDADFFNISAREANLMDPQQRLFLEISWKTIEDAGYDPLSFAEKKFGIFAGVEFNDYQTLIQTQRKTFHGHLATGNSHALLANRISYFLNLRGPSEVIDTACSSSLVAIHRAVLALRCQECEVAIAGGVSLIINPDTFIITSQLGALSKDGRCKTFDKNANGYVKGEGVAAIMLKPLSKALHDKDFIYGVIKGTAVNHGGKTQSLTAPNSRAQSDVIISAYKNTNIDPETITYIEAHGTGTELGDPIEIEGLKAAFNEMSQKNEKNYFCGLGSVKTNIGHLEPASGIAGVIKILLAMQNSKLPAILHFNELNPFINLKNSPFYVVDKINDWKRLKDADNNDIPRRAGVSSFGFGGTNGHILIEEAPSSEKEELSSLYYLLTVSAKTEKSLEQNLIELYEYLNNNLKINLLEFCYTMTVGRAHFNLRAAFIFRNIQELLDSLQKYISNKNYNSYQVLSSEELSNKYEFVCANIYDNSQYIQKDVFTNLAELYLNHYIIDWKLLYKNSIQKIAGLPTYHFLKKKYWYDAEFELQNNSENSSLIQNIPKKINDTVLYLKKIFSEKLRISIDNIAADATYEIYGVDSLLGLEITNQLEIDFPNISKTILYEKNTINELAKYLNEKYYTTLKLNSEKIKTEIDNKEINISNEDIAIIGISCKYPDAENINEFWDNLVKGLDSISNVPLERWESKDYPVTLGESEKYYNRGGFIQDIDKFDPLFFNISPREAILMDPQEKLFMQNVWSTIEDAGYTKDKLNINVNKNVGVFAGITYNFYPLFIADEWSRGNRLPLDIQNFSVANRVSYFLNLNGPSIVVDTACSSSLAAIHLACESLLRDECKMAIAGGVNLSLHPAKYHFLGSYGFLSDKGICASFAEGGTGYVPGEGVGSILLKRLSLALKDNDKIYGVIKASQMNHGGKTSGYTVPNPNAQAELIKRTLKKSNINPRTISYIEAHGTGTALGDPIEIKGLQEAFQDYTDEKQFCAVGSVKSNIGHLESAAGISQLTKVLLQMRHRKLVPSLHAEKLNPYIDFTQTSFYVQRELTDWVRENNLPLRAGISSFGAGGTNVHLIVEEFVETKSTVIHKPFIFLISAMNEEALTRYVKQIIEYLLITQHQNKDNLDAWLTSLCFTSQVGRETFSTKIAIIAGDFNDLINKLNLYLNTPTIAEENFWMNDSIALKYVNKWKKDEKVNWQELYNNNKISITYYPTYPFAKRRCWVTSEKQFNNSNQNIQITSLDEWMYFTKWIKFSEQNIASNKSNQIWLVFTDKQLSTSFNNEVAQSQFIYCFKGNSFQKHSHNEFIINPETEDNFYELFLKITDELKVLPTNIIYLWNDDNNENIIFNLFNFFKALAKQKFNHVIEFCLVTRGGQAVSSSDHVNIWQYPTWSMARIFAAEQANLNILLLDLAEDINVALDVKTIINEIKCFDPKENLIAIRNSEKYVLRLQKDKQSKNLPWILPETVIITGGLGALGFEVAKWLVSRGAKYLLLIGNTILPPRTEWPYIKNATLCEKIQNLQRLEDANVIIKYVAIDIANKTALKNTIIETEKEWNKSINDVFHLAGITTDNLQIADMSYTQLSQILSVKMHGALNLHEIFNERNLNSFVLFSSISALPFFGLGGLSAYATANAFLDGLALYRKSLGRAALSINWAAWADKGMSFKYNHSKFLEAVGMQTIPIENGINILQLLLSSSHNNVIIFKVLWEKFFQINSTAKNLPFFQFLASEFIRDDNISKTELYTKDKITELLIVILASLLKLDITEIDMLTPFSQYGLDSIVGINFISQLNENFKEIVSPMDLYRYPTLQQLADFIFSKIGVAENQEPNEDASLKDILHLSDDEINKLIENELLEMDE